MLDQSDNLLIIPCKHTKFEGLTVAQIVFDIACQQNAIIIILQDAQLPEN